MWAVVPQPVHSSTGLAASWPGGMWLCLGVEPLAHVMEVCGVAVCHHLHVVSSHIIPTYLNSRSLFHSFFVGCRRSILVGKLVFAFDGA